MIGAAIGTIAARSAGFVSGSVVTRFMTTSDEVFLTIDDGPSEKTESYLRHLDDRRLSATWFLTGERADRDPEIVKSIQAAGHSLGNHGYCHLDAWTNSWVRVREDLKAGLRTVERLAGVSSGWTRPPHGRFRPETIAWCRSNRQRLTLWDILAGDFPSRQSPAQTAAAVRRLARPGSIVVMHDHGREDQVESLARIVDGLLEDGWRLRDLPTTVLSPAAPAP